MQNEVRHPHSYAFPYLVVRLAPAIYSVHHVIFTKNVVSPWGDDYSVVVNKCLMQNGFLGNSAKDALVEIASQMSQNMKKNVCVVFSARKCVYCGPDGRKELSGEVPSGGINASNGELFNGENFA